MIKTIACLGVLIPLILLAAIFFQQSSADKMISKEESRASILEDVQMKYEKLKDQFIPKVGSKNVEPLLTEVIAEEIVDSKRRRQLLTEISTAKSVFSRLALESLLVVLAEEGDRESIVLLISARCPKRIGIHNSTEKLLVTQINIKDGMTVLFDAYKAGNPESKKVIESLLRRAFFPTAEVAVDDAEPKSVFVSKLESWFKSNQQFLELNEGYMDHEIRGQPSNEIGIFVLNKGVKQE